MRPVGPTGLRLPVHSDDTTPSHSYAQTSTWKLIVNTITQFHFFCFYSAISYASAVLAVAILSVRLSVRLSVTRVLHEETK